ncbi:hypothetical protein O1L60_03265 [Streptomyces diastatochromogenes]|nr:hypothetical protein [Streptomyces diastatochromogenes]
MLERLDGRPWPSTGVPVTAVGPLRWVTPGLLGPEAAPSSSGRSGG